MLLNLTVSVGSINGLIFYANVVRANPAIFFPSSASNSFLGIFIALGSLLRLMFFTEDSIAQGWLSVHQSS